MDAFATICLILGGVMLLVGTVKITLEAGIDFPSAMLAALLDRRRDRPGFFGLACSYIAENWPETKLDAILYFGGIALIAIGGILFWI